VLKSILELSDNGWVQAEIFTDTHATSQTAIVTPTPKRVIRKIERIRLNQTAIRISPFSPLPGVIGSINARYI
jgi:hypothetical protein